MCTNYHPTALESFRIGAFDDIRETMIQFKPEVFPNVDADALLIQSTDFD